MEDSGRTGGLVPLQPNAKAIDAINDDLVDLYWKSFRLLQQELELPFDSDVMATNRAAEEALSELLSSDSFDFLSDSYVVPTPTLITHAEDTFKTPTIHRTSAEDNSPTGVELLELFEAERPIATERTTNIISTSIKADEFNHSLSTPSAVVNKCFEHPPPPTAPKQNDNIWEDLTAALKLNYKYWDDPAHIDHLNDTFYPSERAAYIDPYCKGEGFDHENCT